MAPPKPRRLIAMVCQGMELEDLPAVGRLVLAEASDIETSLTAANELAIRRA